MSFFVDGVHTSPSGAVGAAVGTEKLWVGMAWHVVA